MVLKNNPESSKESSSKKGSDDAAKQREIEEAKRRREAEEKRREALLLEAKKEKAIEDEKRESEKRREQQIKVEPITVRNADGSVVSKDDHGRVIETKDAKGETRTFGYNDKGELNSFTENGKEWKSKDGQNWLAQGENPRTLRAVVDSADGTFAKVEIHSQSLAIKSVKSEKGNVIEAIDANGITRTFGYNDNKELNSFTDEKGKQWTSSDGQVWKTSGEADRELKVTVNAASNTFTIADASTNFAFVNGNTLTQNNKGSELRDKNNVLLESIPNKPATDTSGDAKTIDRPPLTAEQKQEQINQAATIIHDNSSDFKKISDVLEPMTEAERTQLKETYKNQYNVELQDDLNAKLYKSDAAQCEALFKRKDGVADNTGQIHQALAKLEELAPSEYAIYSGQEQPFTDGQVRAEKQIRDSLSTLTAAQIAEAKTKYQNDYGRDLETDLLSDKNLSLQTKEALKVYFKGSDNRTDEDTLNLADYALKQHRPDIFNDVFREATPIARSQFKAADGYKRIETAFTDEFGGVNTTDAQISKDFLDRGSVSLATLAEGNSHWYHTNREDITRSMVNASEQDRKDFERGEQLSLANEAAKTPEDERALNYYNSVDKALHGAGDNREVAIWEAQLRNHGTFIAEALSSRYEGFWITGIGASTDKNKLIGSVENLSKTDWQYLKSHPEELKNIDRALGTFDDNHREEVMNMLNNKLKAESYEQSQTIANRDIEARLNDCRDHRSRIAAIEGMSQDERQRYLNNQDGLKDRLDQYFAPASAQERYVFNAIVHEAPGQTSAVTRVLLDSLKSEAQPAIVISHIEEAFRADPTLRQRMLAPQTDEDRQLSKWFHYSVESAVTNAGMGARYTKKEGNMIAGSDKQLKEYESFVFDAGLVPLEQKLLLTSDNVDRINIILHASPEDRARLLIPNPDQPTKQFQDTVLGTGDEREVTLYALTQRDQNGNGSFTDADRFRLFALGDKVEQDTLRDTLAKMTPAQRQQLADEYYTKYHRLITSDVIEKVKEDDKWRFRELLSPTDIGVRQIALDSQRALDSHTSDFDPFLKSFWDYSRVSADASQDNLNKFVAEHAKELDKLTPEQRKQFDDAVKNFSEAQKNYINSKGEFAEAFVNATITIAAIGGALFTGGTSLALLATIGAGGALYRVAMMKAIQGSDFDKSAKNIFKQGFEGFTAAALGFMGPEALGLKGLVVGEQLAGQTARKLLTEAATAKLFKEGSEEVLTSALAKITREGAIVGEKEIATLAKKLAAEGVDENLVGQAIRNQLKNDVTAGIRNKLLNEAESYAKNLAAAEIGSGGKEILVTAVGLEDPKTLLDRLGNATVSTIGGVTVFHFAFRGVAGGTKVLASLGRDGDRIVAGEGTVIQHADGTREVVEPGKTLVLNDSDRLVSSVTKENVTSPANLKEDLLAVRELRNKYDNLHVDIEPRANQAALDQQGAQFQKTLRVDDKLLDGAVINGVTVDKNEPLIRDLLNYAKAKYGSLPPGLRAEAYTRFAKTAFQENSEGIANVYVRNYRNITGGKNPYLGDFAKLNSGVCFEESLFLKLLGDQHSDWQVSLVGGISSNSDGFKVANNTNPKLNHAWTEFKFKSTDTPRIYDPRQVVIGETYDEMLARMGTAHVPGQKALVGGMPDAVKIESQGDKLFQMKGFDPQTGQAIVYETNTGFVPQVSIHPSLKSLQEAGWVATTPELYVRNGKACLVSVQSDGRVLLFETPALKMFPSSEVNWQFHKPAPFELNSSGAVEANSSKPLSQPQSFMKGKTVEFADEKFVIAGFDSQSGDAIIYQQGRGFGQAAIFPRLQDGELGTKYQPIRIGDKQYLRDSAGNVFCKTEGEKPILLPETQYRVVPRDQLKIAEPKVEFQESKVKLGNIDAQFAGFDYVVNGEKVEMWRTPDGWLVPAKRPGADCDLLGPVKLDVTALSFDDARKVQQLLIPLLEKDPAFAPPKLLSWKTINPAKVLAGGAEPLAGQKAKLFTLYCDNPADALAVQQKVDEALKLAGLSLDKAPESGNVFKISGQSNRVGIVRDTYTQSVDSTKFEPVINLDPSLAKSIESEFGNGKQLSGDQLKNCMEKIGFRPQDPPALFYDSQGKLSMRVDAGDDNTHHDYTRYGVYVTEANAGRKIGDLTDRPALYALYDRYSIDPVHEAVLLQKAAEDALSTSPVGKASINGEVYELDKVIVVGRGNDAQIKVSNSELVSRRHAAIFTDRYGNTYIADLGSTNGTFINGRQIQVSADSQKPNWVPITAKDKVTLGSGGVELRLQ